jgi:hypothetical protein
VISNLRAMQALARPRMTRKVVTPWRDEEPEDSDESDREMQGTDLTNDSEESEGSGAGRKERRPAARDSRRGWPDTTPRATWRHQDIRAS